MKNPKTIFAHLFPNPTKFYEQRCFNRLKSLLPLNLQETIRYIYRRDNTLYFVLKHPGYVMEINYNKKLIKELLTLLRQQEPHCRQLHITNIKAFAKYTPSLPSQSKPLQKYRERATGSFEISQEFADIFTKIKEAIKKNGTS